MTKGYWVAHMDIEDVDKYKSYQQANKSPFEKFGAKFLIRGGVQDVREGVSKSRTVVIEFESLETAIACYESLDYQVVTIGSDDEPKIGSESFKQTYIKRSSDSLQFSKVTDLITKIVNKT